MEQEKNNKGVIALLVVIIVILLTLVVLLATGTINFKNNESNSDVTGNNQVADTVNDTSDSIDMKNSDESGNNQVADTVNDTSDSIDMKNFVGGYTGKDPWDDNLTIKINSINNDTISLIIETNLITSNDSYKEEVTTELINNTASFNIQGLSESKVNEFNYSLSLTLIDNGIRIKYISGYLSTIGPNGQRASSRNVGGLTSDILTLQKKS